MKSKIIKNLSMMLIGVGMLFQVGCDSSSSSSSNNNDLDTNQARYTITIINEFPPGVPTSPNVHFTPVAGMVHQTSNALWETGAQASPGIVSVAEMGNTAVLIEEIEAHIENGEALLDPIIGATSGGIGNGGVAVIEDVLVTTSHNMISLVTMIGPSPDWFVGIRNIKMYQNDEFREGFAVELLGYDAGTQEGSDFSLQFNNPSTDTSPTDNIVELADNVLVNHPTVLGRVVFVKQ